MVHVGTFWNPNAPDKGLEFAEARAAAQALGMQLLSLELRTPDDIELALTTADRERVDAVAVLSDPVIITRGRRITEYAAQRRIPSLCEGKNFVLKDGGMMSYGADHAGLHEPAAVYVDKILRGARPADLPVEQPTQFHFTVNLKLAQNLGLAIPPSVLARATEIVQ